MNMTMNKVNGKAILKTTDFYDEQDKAAFMECHCFYHVKNIPTAFGDTQ